MAVEITAGIREPRAANGLRVMCCGRLVTLATPGYHSRMSGMRQAEEREGEREGSDWHWVLFAQGSQKTKRAMRAARGQRRNVVGIRGGRACRVAGMVTAHPSTRPAATVQPHPPTAS